MISDPTSGPTSGCDGCIGKVTKFDNFTGAYTVEITSEKQRRAGTRFYLKREYLRKSLKESPELRLKKQLFKVISFTNTKTIEFPNEGIEIPNEGIEIPNEGIEIPKEKIEIYIPDPNMREQTP